MNRRVLLLLLLIFFLDYAKIIGFLDTLGFLINEHGPLGFIQLLC